MTDIQKKIEKQADAGFSANEIQVNLLAEGYTREEIQAELGSFPAQAAAKSSPWKTVWTVIVIVLIIVRLLIRLNR